MLIELSKLAKEQFMKLPKLIKLGHRNLVHHKKQTILIVVVIGALFSILIAVQFIFQGLEDFHRQQSLGVFDNKIYITAEACRRGQIESSRGIERDCVNEQGQLDLDCAR